MDRPGASIRLLQEAELAEAAELADSVFRNDGRASMRVSVPKVFSPALGQSIGYFIDDRLVSFAGLVPGILRVGPARLRVYSYGAVCTHPEYRGQGLASRILAFAKRHAGASDASLLLVSGDLPLYTRAECYRFGVTKRYIYRPGTGKAGSKSDADSVDWACREANETDWFRLHACDANREIAYDSGLWELAELIRAQAVASIRRMRNRTFLAERQGNVAAFCTVAVPHSPDPAIPSDKEAASSRGLVIEWGGDSNAVVHLIEYITKNVYISDMELVVPGHDPLNGELASASASWSPAGEGSNAGTLHIVSAERLFAQLAPYWQAISERVPRMEACGNDQAIITIGNDATPALNSDQLACLLFGRCGETPPLDPVWISKLTPWMPVPLPYTKGLHFV